MRASMDTHWPNAARYLVVIGTGMFILALAACKSPDAPERRAAPNLDPGSPRGNNFFTEVSYPVVKGTLPKIEGAEYVNDDEMCAECHPAYAKSFGQNVHRGEGCESCHGPASKHLETRGKEPGMIFSFKQCRDTAVLAEACLRCHEQNACTEGGRWRTSKHAYCGVTCVNCHRGHYNVPPGTKATIAPGEGSVTGLDSALARFASYAPKNQPGEGKPQLPSLRGTSNHLGAVAPGVCYKCHCDMVQYQQIAGPHQICGPNGFNCTTCHDPHGQIREETREALCLQCHTNAPTMAWHSSIHAHSGVRCTDCHNPHPRSCVPQVVRIEHYQVKRPKRLMMSVQEPETCFKCHQKIYGMTQLPSHHPIREGKMVCSDCHDPHGQYDNEKNLKEATVNLLCYKCHAEKQGPFAFEHPPVRENCAICHNPHGSVVNNLLKQPATFLCLRCHPGHFAGTGHPGSSTNDWIGIDKQPGFNTPTAVSLRRPFYTNCTQCHQQIHGTNRISEESAAGLFTR